MFEYEIVKVTAKENFFGLEFQSNAKIIKVYAEMGYRYVGYIPLETAYKGELKEIELIFEKEVKK